MKEESASSESELEGEEEEVQTDPSLPRLREPWYRDSDPCLVRELLREICPQHILYEVQVKTVARRYDNDDVLFELSDHTHSLVGTSSQMPLLNFRKAMVHLDEVGKIESNTFDEAFPGWEATYGPTDVTTCLVRYYQVWEALEPLLRLPNIFLLATAKQPGFALIGQKLVPSLQSPSNLYAVVLGRLGANHVAEIICTTPVREQENRLLFEILQDAGLTKELLAHLCKTLVEHTAGLPRLIDRVSLS